MKKRWAIAPAADEATVQALHAELGADYGALARVLAQRGLTSLEAIKRWLPGEPLAKVDLYSMADLRVAAVPFVMFILHWLSSIDGPILSLFVTF